MRWRIELSADICVRLLCPPELYGNVVSIRLQGTIVPALLNVLFRISRSIESWKIKYTPTEGKEMQKP